jgi:hypothetical protein
MDSKSNWLSRKWLFGLRVTKLHKSLPFAVVLLLFLIFAPNRMMHLVPQANAGQAQKDSTVYSGQQNSKPDGGQASQVEYVEAKRISIPKTPRMPQEWYAIGYEANTKDRLELSDWPAKLCFSHDDQKASEQDCFAATTTLTKYSYDCQFVEELTLVPIFEKKYPRQGVLFVAKFMGGGSGTLDLVTLWVFNEETKKFVNIPPELTITGQGEYKVLTKAESSLEGVLVIADFIWADGETHFDAHKYLIKIYEYDPKENAYKPLTGGEFVTREKYGIEDKGNTEAIDDEMANIRKLMAK